MRNNVAVFIFDETGDSGTRGQRLKQLLADRFPSVSLALPPADTEAGLSVVLAHLSDPSPEQKVELHSLAAQGAVVVIYTAGVETGRSVPAAETERKIRYRTLAEVERLIKRCRSDWTARDFAAALDPEHDQKRADAFTTLDILCQCVVIKGDSPWVRTRQAAWQNDQRRWRDVLTDVPLGLPVLRRIAAESAKTNIVSLLDWIEGGSRAPDFDKAAREARELA